METELESAVVDLLASGTVLEAKFGDGADDEVNFRLFSTCREGKLSKNVIAPVTNLVSECLDGSAEVVSGFWTCLLYTSDAADE